MKSSNPVRVIVVFMAVIATAGCVTPNLQTPRPLRGGEVQLGAHASNAFSPRLGGEAFEPDDDELAFLFGYPSPWLTARVGLGAGFEIGGTIGLFAATAGLKYGLLEYESPLQVSLLGGAGIWGPILADDVDGLPMIDAGVLAGYDIAEPVSVYGGYRRHQIFVEDIGSFGKNNLIAGVELFPGSPVSLPIELNYTLIPVYLGGMGLPENVSVAAPAINAGITFTF